MLLECVVSLLILITICTIFITINKGDFGSFKYREDTRDNNILMSNIVNELKFNTKIEQLKSKFFDDFMTINVGYGFEEELRSKSILDICNANDDKVLTIKKVKENDCDITMKLSLIVKGEEIIDEEVLKLLWMEKQKK